MTSETPEFRGKSGFTIRSAIIASLMTIFLLASSSYIALKIGALPWPIIFSVVVCGGILALLRKTNFHEINVAQAGSSIGGLMASAFVFVIPGIWFLQKQGIEIPEIHPVKLGLISLIGGVLGILLSIPLRRTFIDKQNLPFPSGAAGAKTLMSSKKNKSLLILIFTGAIAGMFAITRDIFFASGFSFTLVSSLSLTLSIYPMPMAIGIGYILGKKNSFSWFIGSAAGWLILLPILIYNKLEMANSVQLIQNIGMGIILGSGIGFLIFYIVPKAKDIFSPLFSIKNSPWFFKATPILSVISIIILKLTGIPLLASVITVIGIWIVTAIASRMTGETNIDPLEQFGIIVALLVLIIYSVIGLHLNTITLFLIVFVVSVASAIAGDVGHDYKSAKIIGTRPYDIIKIDIITIIIASIFGPLILEIIKKGFLDKLFTSAMPAPQAQMVAGAISGFAYPSAFFIGFAVAFAVELINRFIIKKKVPMMPFGIGMFLGLGLSTMLLVGGIIDALTKKNKNTAFLTAAGMMGGEGIVGFIVAALIAFGLLSQDITSKIFLGILAVIAIITGIRLMKK